MVSALFWFAIVVVAALLGWDWLVKRRRIAVRADMTDREFLQEYRALDGKAADALVLEARRHIARELGLPASKIRPDDELTELRDRYGLVVSGHVGLGDLFEDLQAAGSSGAGERDLEPKSIHQYIAAWAQSAPPDG